MDVRDWFLDSCDCCPLDHSPAETRGQPQPLSLRLALRGLAGGPGDRGRAEVRQEFDCDLLIPVFRSVSGRVVVASWWLFVVLVVSCYTANLAAFLTVTSIGTTINTLEELMAQSQVQVGMVKNGGVHQMLKVMTSIFFIQLQTLIFNSPEI